MIFVVASDVCSSDLALLGNNVRPARRQTRRSPNERTNRRVLAGVNRSLMALNERVDYFDHRPSKTIASQVNHLS